MKFLMQDWVSVLDDDISGRIVAIDKKNITIETTAGFELTFHSSELVKIDRKLFHNNSSYIGLDVKKDVSDKSNSPLNRSVQKFKKGVQPPMEVDLHMEQLCGSKKGMDPHDILTYQLTFAQKKLEYAIFKRIQRIVFIHGVGEGVLKLELEYLFNRYENLKFYPANFQRYGHGATEVYIFQGKTS